MAHAMQNDTTETRLQEIGREIKERIGKFNQLDAQCMAEFEAVAPLMNEAVALCGGEDAPRFAKFKQEYCGNVVSRSRLYELLAIKSGAKTEDEVRAASRTRAKRSRARKKAKGNVTDSESVTFGNGEKADIDGWGAKAKEQLKPTADANPTDEATEDLAEPVEAAQADEAETTDKSSQQPQTSMTPEQALAAYKAAWLEHCFQFTRTMHWNEALVWMREQVEKQDKKAAQTSRPEEGAADDVEAPEDTATEPAEPPEPTIEKIKKAAKAFSAKKKAAAMPKDGNGVGREDSAPMA
jgi:hypothetical protein